ncbi:MAG: PEGA domain-containing protein [Planctomycetota bacterium]
MRCGVAVLLALAAAGCVERRLLVRTVPAGAAVTVNGETLGASPAVWTFDHYGVAVVEAELAGHERVRRELRLRKPWYQLPVLDFVTDVLVPWRIVDERRVTLELATVAALTEERAARELDKLAGAASKLRREVDRR